MKKDNRRKVLLTSVCRPFGEKYGDGFGVSYEGTHQIMWAQGIFRVRATTTQWGIDFIAANIKAPTVTLHYPTMKQFIAELKKDYDYVGIAFISATMHKMLPMVAAIRKHAPSTKIILGGYGAALKDELTPFADYICQEEGVEFMRKLLGEPVNAPIVQPDITQKQSLFSIPLPGETGYIFGGLGCPNGCDFCATSHFFKRKHIKFLPDGPSILQAIEDLREKHPGMTNFWVNDEDFLLDSKRGKGFLEAIRESKLPPLSLSIFGSVKALSKYEPAELVEMGVDWVWVGYEGKRAGYAKQVGKSYETLFQDLKSHGISVLASMVIGFDYQTPEIIEEEFEELLAMRPTMCQFLIYGGPPGTPLQKRLIKEGRIDKDVLADKRLHDGFTLGFSHPHISRAQMSKIQRRLYREEFRRLGPAVFRVVEDWLRGHRNLRYDHRSRVREKAMKLGKDAHMAAPLIYGSRQLLGPKIRVSASRLLRQVDFATGPMTLKERIQARIGVPAAIKFTQFKLKYDLGQQPEYSKREFRLKPEKHAKSIRAALPAPAVKGS